MPDLIYGTNSLCYGVYIVHQFVLVYIYYKSEFVHHLNAYALPWVVLAITVVSSLFLSYLLLKTKVGRFLIG